MPIKVGTLITNLAKKAGLDPNNIAIPSETFELEDDVATAIETKLFNEDAAKNNGALKSYFFKQALDGVDGNITRVLDELQFGDDERNEILGIKSSYDRIPALAKKIKDLESAKAGASKGDKAALQEEINRLNQEKANILREKEQEINKMQAKFEQDFTDNLVKNKIASTSLVTEQFGKEVMEEFAYKFLNQELAAQDAKAVQKGGVLKLVKASDEALDYYADNKPVTFSEFLDSVLAKHKLIAVSNAPVKPPTGTPPINTPNRGVPPQQPVNSSFAALLAQSQADLQKTTA